MSNDARDPSQARERAPRTRRAMRTCRRGASTPTRTGSTAPEPARVRAASGPRSARRAAIFRSRRGSPSRSGIDSAPRGRLRHASGSDAQRPRSSRNAVLGARSKLPVLFRSPYRVIPFATKCGASDSYAHHLLGESLPTSRCSFVGRASLGRAAQHGSSSPESVRPRSRESRAGDRASFA